jgi:hypothetical protein
MTRTLWSVLLSLALLLSLPPICLAKGSAEKGGTTGLAKHRGPSWGPNFLRARGPNRRAPFCRTIVELYRGEVPLPAGANDFVGHVASLQALLDALPPDAPAEVGDDFGQVIAALSALRDANAASGFQAFGAVSDPTLAAAEGRINDYIGDFCGIRIGDPSYEVGTPPGPLTACEAWPRAGSPLIANRFPNLLDTSAANYFLNLFNHGGLAFPAGTPGFVDVPLGGSVELRGEYPKARYFAFHPNDVATNNFNTLRDVDLDPDPGSRNPWREETAPDEINTFTAVFDFTLNPPATPAPNTTYVGVLALGGGTPESGVGTPAIPNPLVFNLLRNYGSFLGALPPNFTGVELPAMTVFDAEGNVVQEFESCDPYPEGFAIPQDSTKFPSWPIADHRTTGDLAGKVTFNWQFGSPVDILTNADVFYTSTGFTKRLGNVFIQRGRKPVSSLPNANPRIDPDAEVRLFTACSYNFWNGVANDCKSEEDIVVDADGFYTLVVSEASDRPRNATKKRGYTWLNWGPFIDGQISLRNLMVDDRLWEDVSEAIQTGTVPAGLDPDFVPRGAHCPRSAFELFGHRGCFLWDRWVN